MSSDSPIEPTTYDLIVIGTGLPETVIAAAATAVGKTVLQIDPNDFNGSHFASLPLHQFTSFLNSHFTAKNPTCSGHAHDHHDFVALELIPRLLYSEIETTNYAPEIPSADKFNIDLAGPRLLFHGDKATDFIIKSGIDLYVENGILKFKRIDEVCVFYESNGKLHIFPYSKGEVFVDKSLKLVEKSKLRSFIKLVQQQDEEWSQIFSETFKISEEDLESPFVDFLDGMQLSAKIKSFILYIAMVDYDEENFNLEVCKSNLKTRAGIERLALYDKLRSENGPGPWIYPKYGHGDLLAFFGRRAAVKGCICAMRRPVTAVLMDKNSGKYKGVRLASGQNLFSHQLVLNPAFTVPLSPAPSPPDCLREGFQGLSLKDTKGKVARGICITASSVKPKTSNCLLVYPPRTLYPEQDTLIRVIQIAGGSGMDACLKGMSVDGTLRVTQTGGGSSEADVCPKGMFVLYFSALCDRAEQGKRLLHAAMNSLLTPPGPGNPENGSTVESEDAQVKVKPNLLWSTLRNMNEHLISTPMPDGNLSYDGLLDAAVVLFQKMYPNEEFFPETPSPGNLEDDTPINVEK
ncbi:rab proteins geranylgeranyltransferase component A 1-like [Prunus yedoensis var. nudiflora]|uniref:Rab proteins geranylgeranyltransferase component A 1-like n=1 Tax=Prunus yedoensis var. nudiflora TaxID=2094558 RepID=A0A314Z1R2_PRUYE|nr:rab proteins geranylgeranyltransferase component A 1-like [Prunus yedoensis var. nudiflora]